MKLGFIGMGNMAQALVNGFISSKMIKGEEVCAYAPNQAKLAGNASKYGFVPKTSSMEVVQASDVVIMACKPYQIESVLSELGNALEGKSLVSIALGWNFDKYSKYLDTTKTGVQFVMPNTPAMVGEGVLLFEDKNSLNPAVREELKKMFAETGVVVELPAHLMGVGGAVTGCGPAFVDLMLEAFADAAVKYGIPRVQAYQLVSQTVLGTAKLQLETGTHPGVLKDAVCSPAGSTIRGVDALEHAGFRAACIDAIDAAVGK